MNSEIAPVIRNIFSRVQKLSPEDVSFDVDLFAVYGLDSLKAAKLLSHVEVEFDILLPDDDIRTLHTLNDVVALVDRIKKRSQQEGICHV
jgi:acyl carrier protein